MPLRVALVVVGVVLGVWSRKVAVDSTGIGYAARTSWGPLYLLVVGWAAMIGAVVVLPERRRSGLLLYAIGVWWFVGELASPSVGTALVFTLGLVLGPAGPALVAQLALGHPTGRLRGRARRIIVGLGYLVMVGVAGVVATSVFDPVGTGCVDCPRNLLLVAGDASADAIRLGGVRIGTAWLLVGIAAVSWRAVAAGPGAWGSVVPISVAACVFLGASEAQYLASLRLGALVTGGPALVVWQLQGASVLGLAGAVGVDLWRAHRGRRDLTRLVVELRDTAPGGLRRALAERLDDPELLIGYPIQDGRRRVDAEGRDVTLAATAGRVVTRLTRGGVELASIDHRVGVLREPQEADDLVSSVQLVLDGERLTAEDLAQLTELRASGARIVAAGDAERRRIERDLHDGAQQRLVALLLTLRLIETETPTSTLARVEAELRDTISDLRRLAHGVYPVLLQDAGLGAALSGLAETRRLVVGGEVSRRYPDVVESTGYLLVDRLSRAGAASAQLGGEGANLVLDVTVDGRAEPGLDVLDRIRTLGGTLDLDPGVATTRARLTLPVG